VQSKGEVLGLSDEADSRGEEKSPQDLIEERA
jgi:hypothetical protein